MTSLMLEEARSAADRVADQLDHDAALYAALGEKLRSAAYSAASWSS